MTDEEGKKHIEVTITFKGTGVEVRGVVDPSHGLYSVTLDGKEKEDTVFKAELESELGHPVIIIPWKMHGDFNARDTDKYGRWRGHQQVPEATPEDAQETRGRANVWSGQAA